MVTMHWGKNFPVAVLISHVVDDFGNESVITTAMLADLYPGSTIVQTGALLNACHFVDENLHN